MELNDALRRIVGQHRRLLGACLLVGLVLSLLLAPHGRQYSASARLVLDTPDPVARQQSEAISDTARAIATSPSQVGAALRRAGVQRGDPADFAKQHVAVTALGSSGVLQLTVTDRDSRVAASVANALASSLIRTRLDLTNGAADQALAALEQRSSSLTEKITKTDEKLGVLGLELATATNPQAADALRVQRDAVQSARDFFTQQRSVIESERVSLLSARAQRPRASVISTATPPSTPEPSHWAVYVALGIVLGLIMGIGTAGVIETLRPTLVGSETLADELDAALLGTLPAHASAASAKPVGARLLLAAEAAGVRNVALFGAGPAVDLDRMAEALNSSSAAGRAHSNGKGAAPFLRIGRFNAESPPVNNGTRSGLVLVSPTALKKTELSDIANLLKVSDLPLLGLITYTPAASGARLGVRRTIEQLKDVVS
jgi:capsular polysaccharide biosynthesis protein